MLTTRIPLLVFRSLVVLCLLPTSATVHAQGSEGDLVYKFKVQTVDGPVAAKAVQAALLQDGNHTSCAFIDEGDHFKLATSVPLTYGSLKAHLQAHGYSLVGVVEVSNGTFLMTPQQTIADQ